MKSYITNLLLKRKQNKENKRSQILKERAEIKERQKYLKTAIWNALVNDDFHKNHLCHYHFMIDGQRHIYGILGLLGIFGDRMFYKIEDEKKEIKKENERKLFLDEIEILNT